MKQILPTNIIAKELQYTHELWGNIKYERLILAVQIQQRSLFIRLMEVLINQLRTKDENFSINFHFNHNINQSKTSDFAEVEMLYPEAYSSVIKEFFELVINNIISLGCEENNLLKPNSKLLIN
jgi:hypothetical protein